MTKYDLKNMNNIFKKLILNFKNKNYYYFLKNCNYWFKSLLFKINKLIFWFFFSIKIIDLNLNQLE